MNETPTPRHPHAMPAREACRAMIALMNWTPPAGVMAAFYCSCVGDAPDERQVNAVISAGGNAVLTIAVTEVPDASTLVALTDAAEQVLRDAWDEPACVGIGPEPDAPADLFAPTGPLNLGATPHPIYNTTRMGRDS